MKKIDPFKIIGIILLAWIALSIHNYSQNGRYKGSKGVIFDTKTGSSYQLRRDREPREVYKGFQTVESFTLTDIIVVVLLLVIIVLIGIISFISKIKSRIARKKETKKDIVPSHNEQDIIYINKDILTLYSNIYEKRKYKGSKTKIERIMTITNGSDKIELDICKLSESHYQVGGLFNSIEQVESIIEQMSNKYNGGIFSYVNWYNPQDPFAKSKITIGVKPKTLIKPVVPKKKAEELTPAYKNNNT